MNYRKAVHFWKNLITNRFQNVTVKLSNHGYTSYYLNI